VVVAARLRYIFSMNNLRKMFGRKVKKIRKEAELTQEELAYRVGISVDFLSLIERGVNAPSFDNIEKLANALDVGVDILFKFDDL